MARTAQGCACEEPAADFTLQSQPHVVVRGGGPTCRLELKDGLLLLAQAVTPDATSRDKAMGSCHGGEGSHCCGRAHEEPVAPHPYDVR